MAGRLPTMSAATLSATSSGRSGPSPSSTGAGGCAEICADWPMRCAGGWSRSARRLSGSRAEGGRGARSHAGIERAAVDRERLFSHPVDAEEADIDLAPALPGGEGGAVVQKGCERGCDCLRIVRRDKNAGLPELEHLRDA